MSEGGFPDRGFFRRVYEGAAPWDIGAPQPELLRLLEEFPPEGRVLDLGSGTGDLAVGLAERGIPVLGVEFVEAAVTTARARLAAAPADVRGRVEFQVADALRPSHWAGTVGAIVDCGFFHLFDAEVRRDLAREFARALPVGGRCYFLEFAITFPVSDVPREVTEAELRALFTPEEGWDVEAIRPARFETKGFDPVPAIAAVVRRAGDGRPRPN